MQTGMMNREGSERAASMQGFAAEFRDPWHYIEDITYKIWEERGIERIRDWYSQDCIVRTAHGVTNSVESVVAGTHATLAEFPDRQLLPEDIIIGVYPEGRGFYSSHRVRSTATHLGDGAFGVATGTAIGMLTIADCLCRENRIVEEWLVRDQASMAMQLGLDPRAKGRAMGATKPGAYTVDSHELLARWEDPAGFTCVGESRVAQICLDALDDRMNRKQLPVMGGAWDRAVRFEGPSGTLCYGLERMGSAIQGILDAIPDGECVPRHAIALCERGKAPRVAIRWTYAGTHSGEGCYGKPTGIPLVMLGISHFELRNDRIIGEWMLHDDLAIWARLEAFKHHN